MAKILGNGGSVVATGTSGNWGAGLVVGSIKSWELDNDMGRKDVTSFGSGGFTEFLGTGNKTGTGKLVMIADGTTALSLVTTTNPTLDLNLISTTRKFSGTAVCGNFSLSVDGQTSDPIEVTFDFAFTGTYTVA